LQTWINWGPPGGIREIKYKFIFLHLSEGSPKIENPFLDFLDLDNFLFQIQIKESLVKKIIFGR
jgi:hypothetical protein